MTSLSNPMQLVLTLVKTQSQVLKPLEGALSLHGLSFNEWLVMYRLNLTPDNSLKRATLAAKIGLTASGITRMLQPMEKVGWIEKIANKRDARISLVRLTKAGSQVLADATKSIEQSAGNITQMLNPQQLEQCIGLLSALHLSAVEASQ